MVHFFSFFLYILHFSNSLFNGSLYTYLLKLVSWFYLCMYAVPILCSQLALYRHVYVVHALILAIIIINISKFNFVISRFVFVIFANIISVTIIIFIIIILYQFFSLYYLGLFNAILIYFTFTLSSSFFWQRFIRHC